MDVSAHERIHSVTARGNCSDVPSDGTATLSAGLFKADQAACGTRN